jgi:hypothetical protein
MHAGDEHSRNEGDLRQPHLRRRKSLTSNYRYVAFNAPHECASSGTAVPQ